MKDNLHGYIQSKILEEEMCKEFIKWQELVIDKGHKVEVVILNPSFIVGPTLINAPNSSAMLFKKIMERSIGGIPNLHWPTVDVRDVA